MIPYGELLRRGGQMLRSDRTPEKCTAVYIFRPLLAGQHTEQLKTGIHHV